jgi:hypothetical protein
MKKIEVTCECQAKKLSIFDEVRLKDGTKGMVVQFDSGSPFGYDICIRSSIGGGETVRRWIRRDEIAEPKCHTCGGMGYLAQLDATGDDSDDIKEILQNYKTGELDDTNDESGAEGFWDLAADLATIYDPSERQEEIYKALKTAAGLYK